MPQQNSYFSTPPVVLNLIIINLLFFLAQSFLPIGNAMTYNLSLHYVTSPDFHIWQLVTYMFLHGGTAHIFTNMFALWMFGRQLEYDLGPKRFLIYYMVCGIGAGLLQLLVNWIQISVMQSSGASPVVIAQIAGGITIGASGAIFGVLLAFGMLHPNARIMLLFPPIPMKAKYFVIGYGVIELLWGIAGTSSITNVGGGIAHFAHVGGMLWGFILLRYWKRKGKIYY